MKKTILALAALAMASIAQAVNYTYDASTGWNVASYTQSDFTNGVLTFNGFTLDNSANWTITGSITVGTGFYNEHGTSAFATGSNPLASSFPGGLQLFVRSSDSKLIIKLDDNSSDVGGFETAYDYSPGDVLSFSLAYTTSDNKLRVDLLGEGIQANYYLTDTHEDDESFSSLSTGIGYANAGSGFITANPADGQTAWAINSITVTGAKVVPEPATATLSLLALAGLAARRRRK